MPDQKNLVQAIYAAIFSGLSGDAANVGPNNFLSLEWPGMPVSDAEYGNPWSPSNTGGSSLSTEVFSELVDSAPNASGIYSQSGIGVESVYSLILDATVKSGGPVSKQFTDAQFKFASTAIGSALNPQLTYHPTYAQPANWTSNAAAWTSVNVDLNAPPAVQKVAPAILQSIQKVVAVQPVTAAWRTAKIDPAILKKAVPVVRPVAPRAAALNFAALAAASPVAVRVVANPTIGRAVSSAEVQSAEQTLVRAAQVRTAAAALRPQGAAVNRVQLSDAVLQRLAARPVVRGPVDPPVVTVPVETKPVTSSSLKLSLQVQRVNVLREWLNPLLFNLPGWAIDGMAAGSISAGAPGGDESKNTGFFPLLPVAFYVIRNVSISGTWSADDKAVASQATQAGSAVSFGPLTLSNPAAGSSTFDGSTLSFSGMQVIAWLSTMMPLMPPTA